MMSPSLRNDSSSDCSSTANQSSINNRKEMGMWLSLMPSGSHSCVLCNNSIYSLKTLEGNQNAETLNFQAQMHNLYLKMIQEENIEKKKRIKGKNIRDRRRRKPVVLPNQVVNNDESSIDLNLHLGPPKKVMKFYEFIPIEK